ncbi:hypothetical protein [Kitasatospora sp. NPDC090091]|uniref:hypothetical protein n=1 Tax=Kitasatospora sp. NPDC090091 TaxID=3364081 RepID=UPI0037F1A591
MTRTPAQAREHANAVHGFVRARLVETAAAAGHTVPEELVTALTMSAYALGRIDGALDAGDIPGATTALNTLHQLAGNWRDHADNPDAAGRQWQRADQAGAK